MVYVLDEPSAGLHPADTEALLVALDRLKANGNSLFVVEHELDVIRRADWLVDVGPGADVHAWGATLALAGTGRPPYGTGRPEAVLYRVVHAEPDLGGLPDALAGLVAAALRKEPADRPALADVVGALRALAPAVLEAAIGRHAWRLRDVEQPSLEQLRVLLPEDLAPGPDDDPAADDLAGPDHLEESA